MVSSDAVKRCVSRDQRQSHGALGYLDRGTWLYGSPCRDEMGVTDVDVRVALVDQHHGESDVLWDTEGECQ